MHHGHSKLARIYQVQRYCITPLKFSNSLLSKKHHLTTAAVVLAQCTAGIDIDRTRTPHRFVAKFQTAGKTIFRARVQSE